MKISIIGAGNVGGMTAMRLAQEGCGEIFLVDIAPGLARGKSFDLDDACQLLKYNYNVKGSEDIQDIQGSDIIVITAGLARKPGMTREDLLNKNASILKGLCLKIKEVASQAIVIIVTNPLDLMTRFALQVTGFQAHKVFGMGVSLDAARFANLVAQELNVSPVDIDACVIGSHGEGMLPLPRFSEIKGVALDELLDDKKIEGLVQKTILRGLEIVTLLGSGSAYFAPSAAIVAIVKAIVKDEKRIIGVSAYLQGEYGLKNLCIGIPCRLGRQGIEKIVELDLDQKEKQAFFNSASQLQEQYKSLSV